MGRRCVELEDEETSKRRRLEEALSAAVLRTCHGCGLQFQVFIHLTSFIAISCKESLLDSWMVEINVKLEADASAQGCGGI